MADQTRRKAGGNQPISRHPLFPAIVALWFGALLGLVSMAIKPALIEQAVIGLGIDSIIPMAAPPLGTTTRILAALVMTGLGGVIGALVARRIARPQPEMHERRRRTASIVESDAPAGFPAREAPVPEAPLPGANAVPPAAPGTRRRLSRESAILNVAEFDLGGYEDEADKPVAAQEDAQEVSGALPLVPALTDTRGFGLEERESLGVEPITPAPEQPSDNVPVEGISIEGPDAISNPLFESYSRQISARVMEAADKSDHGEDSAILPATPAPAILDTSDTETGSDPIRQAEDDRGRAAERIATAELDALSQVELLERLALAMAQRRDEIARAAASGAPETFETAEANEPEPEIEPASQAEPPAPMTFEPLRFEMPRLETVSAIAPAGNGHETEVDEDADEDEDRPELPQVPAALRPVGYHPLDEDDVLPGYIPPRHIGIAADTKDAGFGPAAFDEEAGEDEEEEDSDVLNEGYSSLLDLSRSSAARQPFARVEEPEIDEIQSQVIFPGESTPDPRPASEGRRPFDAPGGQGPEETERALRAALATLQRMSGAA